MHANRSISSISQLHACCAFSLTVLAGCAGLSEVQDSVSHLDQGAHAASSAEASFLASVQTTECDSQFLTAAYKFSTDKAVNFQLADYCHPTILTTEQLKLRTAMMDALVLYADKMLAIATKGDNKTLGTDARTLATNLKALAKNGGVQLPKAAPEIATGVEAAFVAIAEMALDEKKYKGIVEAAHDMQTPVDNLVRALTTENYGFAQEIVGAHEVLESELREEITDARCITVPIAPDNKPRGERADKERMANVTVDCSPTQASAADTFFAILRARETLAKVTGSTIRQMATADWSSLDLSKPMNDALSAIAKANKAIATGGAGGVYAAAHDLYNRSMAAKDQYNAMIK
jgi:hypothetical protein